MIDRVSGVAGQHGDDAAGDDLPRVRDAGAGRVAQRGEPAPVAHAAPQEVPQALRQGTLRLHAAAGSDAARPNAGARPRQEDHRRGCSEKPLVEECGARAVSCLTLFVWLGTIGAMITNGTVTDDLRLTEPSCQVLRSIWTLRL